MDSSGVAEEGDGWVVEVFEEAVASEGYELRPQMRALLARAVTACLSRGEGLECLLTEIWRGAGELPAGRLSAVALETRLSSLLRGPLSRVFSSRGGPTGLLERGSLVLDLSGSLMPP